MPRRTSLEQVQQTKTYRDAYDAYVTAFGHSYGLKAPSGANAYALQAPRRREFHHPGGWIRRARAISGSR